MTVSGPVPRGVAGRGITWYDVLDVLPDASVDTVQQAYEAKVRRASALTVQVWHPPAGSG
jgi:hypothetical protein